jgi:hypothetical protein
LLVITDEFLPIVGIAGPLQLRPLIWSKGSEKDAELVLKFVLQADGGVLHIGRFDEIALTGHRAGFEVAVENESPGEVAIG